MAKETKKISAEVFLLGGDVVVNSGEFCTQIEGFHALTNPEEFPENFKSFEVYKATIAHFVNEYAWDLTNSEAVDYKKAVGIQTFDMPDDKQIMKWYGQFLISSKENSDEN